MATYDTTAYTAQAVTRTNTTRLLDANVVSGTVEFAVIPYTTLASYTTGDTIRLCVLPNDCQPLPALSKFIAQTNSGGTGLIVSIGSALVPAGYLPATTVSGILGEIPFTKLASTQPAWNAPTDLVADTVNAANVNNGTTILATVTTGGTVTVGTVCYFVLAYKRGK